MGDYYVQANTNGRLHDAREPSIAPLNRGFLYGDAIYEVWRTYHGVVFAWEEHWERLEGSARALALELPWSRGEILAEIRRTALECAARSDLRDDVYVRLQVTRGGGPIGLDPALADRADYVLLVRGNQDVSLEQLQFGLRLSLAQGLHRNDRRTLDPAWKTGNYLNNLLCLREAKSRGADEVIITNLAGEITEAAVSNIYFVRDGVVFTPDLESGLLGGVTRRLLIERIAPEAGVELRETVLRPARHRLACRNAFSARPPGTWFRWRRSMRSASAVRPDSVTMRLKAAFAKYALEYARLHPELRLLP